MQTKFIVSVCQNPPELLPQSAEWIRLGKLVSAQSPYLFLLNEMPFGEWLASKSKFSQRSWNRSCELHQQGIDNLAELEPLVVAGSRPRNVGGGRVNQAFLRTKKGVMGGHTKQYFPNEPGYYEAHWFSPGKNKFELAVAGPIRVGFLICTDLMFNEHARWYGRQGAHAILVPRATETATLDRWLVALRMAAIVSGCYVLSSNRVGADSRGQVFGGCGWIISPFGELLAQTSHEKPVVSHEIDLSLVSRAQRGYPCYVAE